MYSQLVPIRVHSFLPSQHILEVLSKVRLFWTSADSCAALSESQQGQLDGDSLVSHHPESCTRGFWGWPCVLCQLWNVSLLTAFNFCLQRDKSKWGEKHSDSTAGYEGFHMTESSYRGLKTQQLWVGIVGLLFSYISLQNLGSFAPVSSSPSAVAPCSAGFWFLVLDLWWWQGWGAAAAGGLSRVDLSVALRGCFQAWQRIEWLWRLQLEIN